jgi:Transmembrane secretion effector
MDAQALAEAAMTGATGTRARASDVGSPWSPFLHSWFEHMRQHQRVTNADRVLQDAVHRFNAETDPAVRHLVAARSSETT